MIQNNEATQGISLMPLLINQPPFMEAGIMTEIIFIKSDSKNQVKKGCTKCETEKFMFEFHKRSDRDSYLSWCKECKHLSGKRWVKNNREKHRLLCNTWYEDNKEKHLADGKNWYQNNKHRKLETTTAREKRCRLATPVWADRELMKEIYAQAREMTEATGIPHEVDHIIPLQGETVCGLHVHNNLQILTQEENRHKANKLEV